MKTINDLREELFDTIQKLKDGKIDRGQASCIADLGQVIINSAKAENDFINKVGGEGSGFIPVTSSTPSQIERPKAEYSNKGHLQLLKKYAE